MKKFILKSVYENLPNTAARLEWVEKSGRALARSISSWQKGSNNQWTAKISEDRLQCVWILKISKNPPLASWGHRFGDMTHNLRSILDNAVYEGAVAAGITKGLDKLEFPICSSQVAWDASKWKLIQLPATVIKIIEELQPYKLKDSQLRHDLLSLNLLNNVDKHRIPIVSAAVVQTAQVTVEATPMKGEKVHEWHWIIDFLSAVFMDGVTTLRLRSQEKLGKLKGQYRAEVKFFVTDIDGQGHGLTESLAWMLDSATKVATKLAEV